MQKFWTTNFELDKEKETHVHGLTFTDSRKSQEFNKGKSLWKKWNQKNDDFHKSLRVWFHGSSGSSGFPYTVSSLLFKHSAWKNSWSFTCCLSSLEDSDPCASATDKAAALNLARSLWVVRGKSRNSCVQAEIEREVDFWHRISCLSDLCEVLKRQSADRPGCSACR